MQHVNSCLSFVARRVIPYAQLEAGQSVFTKTGGLDWGKKGTKDIESLVRSCERFNVEVEVMDGGGRVIQTCTTVHYPPPLPPTRPFRTVTYEPSPPPPPPPTSSTLFRMRCLSPTTNVCNRAEHGLYPDVSVSYVERVNERMRFFFIFL